MATLGQLLPHTPGQFFVNLNGVYEVPFPNKEIGAWMTNLRNRHLAAALVQESLDKRLHDEADATSASGMIRDCATVEDAVHQFRDGNYFQVTVHGDPLVTQCDALGVVLPIFSTPVQAISFLQDIVDVDIPGSPVVTMDDVLISSVSGAKVRCLLTFIRCARHGSHSRDMNVSHCYLPFSNRLSRSLLKETSLQTGLEESRWTHWPKAKCCSMRKPRFVFHFDSPTHVGYLLIRLGS